MVSGKEGPDSRPRNISHFRTNRAEKSADTTLIWDKWLLGRPRFFQTRTLAAVRLIAVGHVVG